MIQSFLLNSLKKTGGVTNNGGLETIKTFNVPTGFTLIDMLGGNYDVNMQDIPVINGGITNRAYTTVGESATGKTTIEIQEVGAASDWWNTNYPVNGEGLSDVIFYNLENNTPINRIQKLLRWSDLQCMKHLIMVNGSASAKAIFDTIINIANIKEKNKKMYVVDTHLKDINGEPVKSYIHTYVLVDSIPAIKNINSISDYDKDREGNIKIENTDSISGNMDAMREAKENTDFILKVKPICEKYGIVLKMINHVVVKPKISMFDVQPKILPSLRPGESLKGGKEFVFQSYGITSARAKEKLDDRNPVYGDNIRGVISQISYIKNKANSEGVFYRMVFDGPTGYRHELSDFEYCYSNEMYGIGGSPARYFMKILPEVTFTRKKLKEKCENNHLLTRAIQFTAKTNMIYNLILRSAPPDFNEFMLLSYEERIAIILNFTNPYPTYEPFGLEINEETKMAKTIGDHFIKSDTKADLSNSFLTNFMLSVLIPDEDGMSYVPKIGQFTTPFNEIEGIGVYGEYIE